MRPGFCKFMSCRKIATLIKISVRNKIDTVITKSGTSQKTKHSETTERGESRRLPVKRKRDARFNLYRLHCTVHRLCGVSISRQPSLQQVLQDLELIRGSGIAALNPKIRTLSGEISIKARDDFMNASTCIQISDPNLFCITEGGDDVFGALISGCKENGAHSV
ncbi:hypothetical protein F2P81_007227 [Scophthalmus maximus]|uniref:Uncharacterized protein n=1 Tax=Scophthalmus maximus TaxID=52904 RepID=A0A6A4T904_SCOMX|nr:hypothetical protein F2P81_007227 [Scophthalmus maximus]